MPTANEALQGEYSDGEQQGKWVWWHENGQKSIVGEYKQGHPMGQWTWWNEDGKVARASDMAQGAGQIVQTPAPLTARHRCPNAGPPAPRSASSSHKLPRRSLGLARFARPGDGHREARFSQYRLPRSPKSDRGDGGSDSVIRTRGVVTRDR